jgi:hypothetical protein
MVLAVRPLAAAQDRAYDQPQDQPAAQPHGVPYDWSHHHVIFSNPGTAEDAMRKGTYDHWFHTVNDPRYQQDQVRRHRHQEPNEGQREWGKRHEAESGGLWGQSLGSNSATVGAGTFPAKYSFDSNTLNCANAPEPDYVVYNTSVAPSAGQASVIAFDNIYASTCTPSTAVPTVYWAYNTAGTVSTSVVLSEDGYQAAFVQSAGSKASLVILKYKAGQGASATSAATPDSVSNCTSTTGSCGTPAGAYATCRVGATSCLLTLQFSNVGGATPNDTNSPPYYDYASGSDTIWVGDNSGYIHKFTGVFKATPTEVVGGGWPVQVSTKASPILTGAVYESNSKLLFVNDATGYLYSVTTTGATTQTVNTSGQMECGTNGFSDPPIVDSTTGNVYIFAGDGCDEGANPGNSYINRFNTASVPPVSGYGLVAASFGNHTTNLASTIMHIGTFDNLYFEGTGNTGNMYTCVNGEVYQTTMATLSTTGPVTTNAYAKAVSGALSSTDVCSPVSELQAVIATTKLTANLGGRGRDTGLTVTSSSGFAIGDYIRVDSEDMLITGVGTGTITATRGQLGTPTVTHNSGATVNDEKDWLFLSVSANGNATTSCTGACIYNYDVFAGAVAGTATAGRQVIGGTSGITVDNTTIGGGGSQVYFTYLGSATAGVKCPSPSGGAGLTLSTGGCAVQATQLGLN